MKQKRLTLDSIAPKELELITKKRNKVHLGTYRSYPACIKGFPQPITLEHLQTIANIRHPNFPIFYGSCLGEKMDGVNFISVIEQLEGSVFHQLNSNIKPFLTTKMKWARDVALGITWLHCNKPMIVIKTLKTSNIMYDNTNRVKVNWINEYIANSFDSPISTDSKNSVFAAPELVKDEFVTEKVDVYSFGVILLELLFNKVPTREMCENPNKISFGHIPPLLKDLILGCLHVSPYQRPSFPLIVDRMDDIISSSQSFDDDQTFRSYINNSMGEKFWRTNFSSKTLVPWQEFSTAFYSHFNLQLPVDIHDKPLPSDFSHDQLHAASEWQLEELSTRSKLHSSIATAERNRRLSSAVQTTHRSCSSSLRKYLCLKLSLVDKNNIVSADKFGNLLKYYGAFCDDLIDRIETVFENKWFSHDISSEITEKTLLPHKRKAGTFLVRLSKSNPGSYCVSYVNESGRIVHLLIPYSADGYRYSNRYFDTLSDLVNHLTSHSLISKSLSVSKCSSLFVAD